MWHACANEGFVASQQFGASKTFVDKTVWPIHLPKTFSVSKRWFCVPGVVPFLFDLLDSRCPKSRPHFEGGLPDKWHFAILYFLAASKSGLMSHCPLCLQSSTHFGRNWNDLFNHRIWMIIELWLKSETSFLSWMRMFGKAWNLWEIIPSRVDFFKIYVVQMDGH